VRVSNSEDSITGSRPQISQLVFFLGAFQQSAGLITCKDYEVIERRNLGRERSRDILVKTM